MVIGRSLVLAAALAAGAERTPECAREAARQVANMRSCRTANASWPFCDDDDDASRDGGGAPPPFWLASKLTKDSYDHALENHPRYALTPRSEHLRRALRGAFGSHGEGDRGGVAARDGRERHAGESAPPNRRARGGEGWERHTGGQDRLRGAAGRRRDRVADPPRRGGARPAANLGDRRERGTELEQRHATELGAHAPTLQDQRHIHGTVALRRRHDGPVPSSDRRAPAMRRRWPGVEHAKRSESGSKVLHPVSNTTSPLLLLPPRRASVFSPRPKPSLESPPCPPG